MVACLSLSVMMFWTLLNCSRPYPDKSFANAAAHCLLAQVNTDLLLQIGTREFDVLVGADIDPMSRFAAELFPDGRRRARGEHALGNFRAFADNASRRDKRALSDNGIRKDHCVASDKRMRLYVTIFHHGGVTDRNVI